MAAGSRHVDRITLNGRAYKGNMAIQQSRRSPATLTGHLTTGAIVTPLSK
jgi:hypothetical protein